MNLAHVHIALNHIPVIGLPFVVLLLLYAVVRRSTEVARISLGFLVLLALATIPVFLAGEGAEDIVERFPGVTEAFIEHHEDWATFSFAGVLAVGVIALGGLVFFRSRKEIPRGFVVSSLILAVIAAGMMAGTANLGGQIRHTEIREDWKSGVRAEPPVRGDQEPSGHKSQGSGGGN